MWVKALPYIPLQRAAQAISFYFSLRNCYHCDFTEMKTKTQRIWETFQDGQQVTSGLEAPWLPVALSSAGRAPGLCTG